MKSNSENEENVTRDVKEQIAFQYPTCWNDDERMAVLFAPFRERSVNVESYDSKVKFWQELIISYCEYKNEALFTTSELQTIFTRKQRKPECLSELLHVLLATGQVRPFNEFCNDPLNKWSSWTINYFIKRPVDWCVGKLKTALWFAIINNNNNNVQFVVLPLMQNYCEILQTKILSINCGQVLHYRKFQELLAAAHIKLSEQCLQLCLHTLHCQHKIFIEYAMKTQHQSRIIDFIKIPAAGKESKNELAISDFERSVIILEMSKEKLSNELQKLEEGIKLNQATLLNHLKNKEKQLAKLFLRKKKLLEKQHEKHCSAMFNIETLLLSLKNAHTDKEILGAYKIGSKALQNVLKSPEMKYDNVDDVINDMCESLETYRDIQDTMANVDILHVDNDNIDELDRELNELINESTKTDNNYSENTISSLLEKIEISTSPILSNNNNNDNSDNNIKQSDGKCESSNNIVTL